MENDKVAVYCRLSVEDVDKIKEGDDSESIQNQKLLLVDYALEQNWAVHKVYSDDDYSGLDRERPEFRRMIQDAKDGKFNIILCKHQSRFTRDMELIEKYLHGLFVLWGIRFVSVIDHVDTNIKGNKKSRQINALINEWYVEDLSENIRAVFKRKMQDGQFLGSFASYGYIKDPADRHKIIIDPDAADVVRKIYSLYLQGNGVATITKILTETGVHTPAQHKIQKGLTYANDNSTKYSQAYGAWATNTVRRILTNKVYIGHLIQGRERKVSYKSKKVIITPEDEWIVIENNHTPIIDEKTFYSVQKLIENKRKIHKPKNGYKGSESSYILAGKVKCLDCGYTMQKGSPSRDGKTFYLRCALSHKTNSKACSSHSIRLDSVISGVETKIRSFINNYMNKDENVDDLKNFFQGKSELGDEMTSKRKELKIIDDKISEISHIIASAYADKIRGNISDDDFLSFKAIYEVDIEKHKKRKLFLEEEIRTIEIRIKSLSDVNTLIHKYVNFKSITHEIINEFTDCIYIGEKKENKEQEVVINWLF